MGAIQSATHVPGDGKWERKAQRTELPPETTPAGSRFSHSRERCVGNPYYFFSARVATGPDAMNIFIKLGVLRCSVFVRTNVGAHLSALS
jgi:hypothetical protein